MDLFLSISDNKSLASLSHFLDETTIDIYIFHTVWGATPFISPLSHGNPCELLMIYSLLRFQEENVLHTLFAV